MHAPQHVVIDEHDQKDGADKEAVVHAPEAGGQVVFAVKGRIARKDDAERIKEHEDVVEDIDLLPDHLSPLDAPAPGTWAGNLSQSRVRNRASS